MGSRAAEFVDCCELTSASAEFIIYTELVIHETMQYEDGEETKSDFLARMILEGRIDYDAEKKTLKSNVTCQQEEPELCLQRKALKEITNPIIGCDETAGDCAKYSVIAKGFFSSYTPKAEQDLLDGAKNL